MPHKPETNIKMQLQDKYEQALTEYFILSKRMFYIYRSHKYAGHMNLILHKIQSAMFQLVDRQSRSRHGQRRLQDLFSFRYLFILIGDVNHNIKLQERRVQNSSFISSSSSKSISNKDAYNYSNVQFSNSPRQQKYEISRVLLQQKRKSKRLRKGV